MSTLAAHLMVILNLRGLVESSSIASTWCDRLCLLVSLQDCDP